MQTGEAGSRLKYIKKLVLWLKTFWDKILKYLYLTPSHGEPGKNKKGAHTIVRTCMLC